MGHDVRIKVVFDYECPLLEPRILTNPHMIQTGHIWFFQLAVCFWVLGLPLFAGSGRVTACMKQLGAISAFGVDHVRSKQCMPQMLWPIYARIKACLYFGNGWLRRMS